MLENLLNLIKENASEAIINNPAIPNERNDEAVEAAQHSIMDELKGGLQSGNFSDMASMLSGSSNGNGDMITNMVHKYSGTLGSKFGLDEAQSSQIASSLIPKVMNLFQKKTDDPNDSSFDLGSMATSLLGNGGLGSMLSGFLK